MRRRHEHGLCGEDKRTALSNPIAAKPGWPSSESSARASASMSEPTCGDGKTAFTVGLEP
jgi:hypothetical protein